MIKGISERRRLRRIGKIRLGEKKINKDGKAYPSALDHFNFVDAPGLEELYGKNCKEIEIMLPNENPDAFFPQERKCYRTSGLFCRGDGETATRVNIGLSEGDKMSKAIPKGQPLDPDGMSFIKEQGLKVDVGDMFDLPCPGEECPFTEKKLCRPIGRFLFLVPKAPHIGVYEISTTSYNSIIELNSSIDTIRGVAGRISMIPLRLRLIPREAKIPKSTMKKTIHHLVLEFSGSFADLAQYRNIKQIPLDRLPSRHELEQHVPEDLIPHGGADLDAELSGGPKPIPGPVAAKPAAPIHAEGGISDGKIIGVFKKAGNYRIVQQLDGVGEREYFSKEETMASAAKSLKLDDDAARITWTRGADDIFVAVTVDRT
jgi:hypothetical protein